MDKTQQQLLDLMVDQVLTKHGVEKDRNLSLEDKKRLKEVVQKLQEDVEKFSEQANKTYTEHNVPNQRR
ncbi:spore coat protein [Salipaludibacillus daqingensis]|uniref:spore coat protein n=1 Tax=Salipaludibacillus daqingensis TaxID=3041001 RepID=UPI002475D2F4|nr:spore coat protein [Salipaludibacillus daqingensis]